jgi:hypothetical protein
MLLVDAVDAVTPAGVASIVVAETYADWPPSPPPFTAETL